jgi:cargo-transport protein YPP1
MPTLNVPDTLTHSSTSPPARKNQAPRLLSEPLGLGTTKEKETSPRPADTQRRHGPTPTSNADEELPAPYKAASIPLVDRLAARDRAYGLLSGLTKLGTGWDYSEAWFALARAHEESGQVDKAKEVLWWCVELEEGMGVRDWRCLGGGGYIL